jgi:hypothetical protein
MESREVEEREERWGGRDEDRCWDRGWEQQNQCQNQHWEAGKEQDEARDPSQKPGRKQGQEEVVEVEAVEEQEGQHGDRQQEQAADNVWQKQSRPYQAQHPSQTGHDDQ